MVIINPNWLRVERATIFFKSVSRKALILAINKVKDPFNAKAFLIAEEWNNGASRIKRYTPAVTKVEEWTKAETGVGAAMAAGSQDEKGVWALLVNLASIKSVGK